MVYSLIAVLALIAVGLSHLGYSYQMDKYGAEATLNDSTGMLLSEPYYLQAFTDLGSLDALVQAGICVDARIEWKDSTGSYWLFGTGVELKRGALTVDAHSSELYEGDELIFDGRICLEFRYG